MKNIIMIGLPGSGKGTQAKKIAEKFGYEHISAGDIIREEQKNNTAIGDLASRMSDVGMLLPDDVIITLIRQRIIDSKNKVGFVFDGFPRTVDQAKSLDVFLYGRQSLIDHVFNLTIQDSVVKNRILERSLIENRVDDKEEVIDVRIKNYKTQTQPILGYFEKRKITSEINAEKDIDAVFGDIEKVLS